MYFPLGAHIFSVTSGCKFEKKGLSKTAHIFFPSVKESDEVILSSQLTPFNCKTIERAKSRKIEAISPFTQICIYKITTLRTHRTQKT